LLLDVRGLTSRFYLADGVVRAVEEVSFELAEGESLGIVGESGSGKTATAMSLLGLLPPPGRIVSGEIVFEGRDLLGLDDEEMRSIRGGRIAFIPQNPMAALNPLFTVGWQLREALSSHRAISRNEARTQIMEALHSAGIPEPRMQIDRYPHEFSGGMRQRILIAMATLNQPTLLLADEPTTALDTTMQARILELIAGLVERNRMAVVLITHNMGVVASICEKVVVMYAGQVVESGPVGEIFRDPWHPYTRQLLLATPRLGRRRAGFGVAEGEQPKLTAEPHGCAFRSRCPLAENKCLEMPALLDVGGGRSVRCWVAQRDLLARAGIPVAVPSDGSDDGRGPA
jgi:oligopeptide transport system ATP-binding protein